MSISGAELVVKQLEAQNVRYVFGVPALTAGLKRVRQQQSSIVEFHCRVINASALLVGEHTEAKSCTAPSRISRSSDWLTL